MTKDSFLDWYRRNPLFRTLTDLVCKRMFMRSKDVFKEKCLLLPSFAAPEGSNHNSLLCLASDLF